jgi:hypothetical protein
VRRETAGKRSFENSSEESLQQELEKEQEKQAKRIQFEKLEHVRRAYDKKRLEDLERERARRAEERTRMVVERVGMEVEEPAMNAEVHMQNLGSDQPAHSPLEGRKRTQSELNQQAGEGEVSMQPKGRKTKMDNDPGAARRRGDILGASSMQLRPRKK